MCLGFVIDLKNLAALCLCSDDRSTLSNYSDSSSHRALLNLNNISY